VAIKSKGFIMKKVFYFVAVAATVTQLAANPLFNSCKGCHGMKGEKVAMGKSKIIAKMSSSEIKKALIGYKDGTYGGSMKAVMKGQVIRLSDEDIRSLASYITSLK
jgi:cytochrome c553